MAEKKRRRNVSPISSTSAARKRARHSSNVEDRSSPYSPAEWKFRLKVISAQAIDEEVFEDAINDLVEMCFPETVLDEIGVDVITEHMRQESAPEANVEKMQKVFQSAMVKRVSRMLAHYLDDQAKFNTAITTLKNEVQGLHEYFAFPSLASEREDDDDDDYDQTTRQTSPMDKDQHLRNPNAQEDRLETKFAYVFEKPNITQKKVSKSQRWDVDPDHLTVETVPNHFRKTSDLYAYHALSIVTRDLENNATMEEKCRAMESRMAVMPREEWKQWEDSYKKLRDGELAMLGRVTNDKSSDSRNHHSTPAPTSLQRHHKDKDTAYHEEAASTCSQKNTRTEEALSAPPVNLEHVNVRLESSINSEPVGIPIDTMHPERRRNLEASAAFNPRTLETNQVASAPGFQTPLVDLLWGPTPLTKDDFPGNVDKIIHELSKRVTAESIESYTCKGRPTRISHNHLKGLMNGVLSNPHIEHLEKRQRVEHYLEPWAADHLKMFPELRNTLFFFRHFLPTMTPVLDVVLETAYPSTDPLSACQMITRVVKKRGISTNYLCGRPSKTLATHLGGVASHPRLGEREKWVRLDRFLREVAFMHRDKFPELSSSKMVKRWEGIAATRFI